MSQTAATWLFGLVLLAVLQASVIAINPNWQAVAICESKETLRQSEDCCISGALTSGWPTADSGSCTQEVKPCDFSPDFKANWRCPTCRQHHLNCSGNARPSILYYNREKGGWYIKPGKTCNGLRGGEAVFTFITQGCSSDDVCLCGVSLDSKNGESFSEEAGTATVATSAPNIVKTEL